MPFMPDRLNIEFIPAGKPTTEFVTKFGGQPCWIGIPEWPLGKTTGKPMTFVCQIDLTNSLFGDVKAKMAYLFMADDPTSETWDPNAGDNAVIIQPGPNAARTAAMETGPSIQQRVPVRKATWLDYLLGRSPRSALTPCEFNVKLTPETDPEFMDESAMFALPEKEREAHLSRLAGDKT